MMATAVVATGCGKNGGGFIKNASVTPTTVNGDVFANLTLDLNTGNLNLGGINVPIKDPKHPNVNLGTISWLSGGNFSEIKASINLSKIANVHSVDGHNLPNGTPIPVGGLDNVPVMAIPISNGIVVYVAFAKDTAVMGAAIPIKEFAEVSKLVGGLNFFPSFQFGKDVQGVAGIYTSAPGVNKNGISFFIDASGILPKTGAQTGTLASSSNELRGSTRAAHSMSLAMAPSAMSEPLVLAPRPRLTFGKKLPSNRNLRKFSTAMNTLGNNMDGDPLTVGE